MRGLHCRCCILGGAEEIVETHIELRFWSRGVLVLGAAALPLVMLVEVVGFSALVVVLVALGVRAATGTEA